MSNGSPTAFLTWAILASLVSGAVSSPSTLARFDVDGFQFFAFLLYHLWSYDRLQCLKWNAGRQPGAFRRLMTVRRYIGLGYIPLSSIRVSTVFVSGINTVVHHLWCRYHHVKVQRGCVDHLLFYPFMIQIASFRRAGFVMLSQNEGAWVIIISAFSLRRI
jgi:hypothetical protein